MQTQKFPWNTCENDVKATVTTTGRANEWRSHNDSDTEYVPQSTEKCAHANWKTL